MFRSDVFDTIFRYDVLVTRVRNNVSSFKDNRPYISRSFDYWSREMALRGCKHSNDEFCYVCGTFLAKNAKKHPLKNRSRVKEAYLAYFGIQIGDQDKSWAPHVICEYCCRTLEGWFRGERRTMPFGVPRIWREPTNHHSDCYFCMVDPTRRRKGKNAPPIEYPDIPSSMAPVPHNQTDLPVPQPPSRHEDCPTEDHEEAANSDSDDSEVQVHSISRRTPSTSDISSKVPLLPQTRWYRRPHQRNGSDKI